MVTVVANFVVLANNAEPRFFIFWCKVFANVRDGFGT
jgi:hypothetical protein